MNIVLFIIVFVTSIWSSTRSSFVIVYCSKLNTTVEKVSSLDPFFVVWISLRESHIIMLNIEFVCTHSLLLNYFVTECDCNFNQIQQCLRKKLHSKIIGQLFCFFTSAILIFVHKKGLSAYSLLKSLLKTLHTATKAWLSYSCSSHDSGGFRGGKGGASAPPFGG